MLWSLTAYLSILERPTTRALWHAFFAYALGGFIMWEAYFVGPFIALHSLGYAGVADVRQWLAAHVHAYSPPRPWHMHALRTAQGHAEASW